VIFEGADEVNFIFDRTSLIWHAIYVIDRYGMRERLCFESLPVHKFCIYELSCSSLTIRASTDKGAAVLTDWIFKGILVHWQISIDHIQT